MPTAHPKAARRAPIKAINKTPTAVAKQAEAEKKRKAESRAALKAQSKANIDRALTESAKDKAAKTREAMLLGTTGDGVEVSAHSDGTLIAPQTPERSQRAASDHDAYLAALRVDALASGCTIESEVEAYIQEQLTPVKTKYSGPMLILRDAARRYVKPKNGNPCCGDELSQLCGEYNREVVVKALILALKFQHNPYAHLNPGQQSMNLRNKTRAALKSGLITMADITTALKSV